MVRVLVITLLMLVAFCDSHTTTFFHYTNGTMSLNKQLPVKIDGLSLADPDTNAISSLAAGMYVSSSEKIPFAIYFVANKVERTQDGFSLKLACGDGFWKGNTITFFEGEGSLNATSTEISLSANCVHVDTNDHLDINIHGKVSQCVPYTPDEAAIRARVLLKESTNKYLPPDVIFYSFTAITYIYPPEGCNSFLDYPSAKDVKPGLIIVGNDAKHCAILNDKADAFIHANPVTKTVTETPIAMIGAFFRKGYTLKYYPCDGTS